MAATKVGLDWGMAALGINSAPHKSPATVINAGGLTERYGPHAAVSTVSFAMNRDDFSRFLSSNNSARTPAIATTFRTVFPTNGSVRLLGPSTETQQVVGTDRNVTLIEPAPTTAARSGCEHLNTLAHLRLDDTSETSGTTGADTTLLLMSMSSQVNHSSNYLNVEGAG